MIFDCKICKQTFRRKAHFNDHMHSNKHKRKAASQSAAEAAVKKQRLQESGVRGSVEGTDRAACNLKLVYIGLKNVFEIHRAELQIHRAEIHRASCCEDI